MAEEKTSSGTDVAVKEAGNSLALMEDFLGDTEDNSFEDFSQGDLLVPYIRIIQALSKELQKNHAKYLKDAEAGMFVNSATRKLWDGEKGFWAIPIHFSHRYQAWRPNNGGPADDYGANDAIYKSLIPDAKGKRINSDGNEVTDSNQYFILIVDPESGEHEMGVLSMSGSQAKKARGWNSIIQQRRVKVTKNGVTKSISPPPYFFAYHITTTPESNDQGSWMGFSISPESKDVASIPGAREILELCKLTRQQIKDGELKAAPEEHDGPQGGVDDEEEEQAF